MNEQNPARNIAHSDEFSETLLVFDQEKQTLQAVKELDKNGKLKTVDPTQENNPDFIRLDKNGDFLSNFYSNFVAQLKDPTRFRVFKIPIPKISFLAETIKSILKDPTPAGNAILEKYEVKNENLKQNISPDEIPQKGQGKLAPFTGIFPISASPNQKR